MIKRNWLIAALLAASCRFNMPLPFSAQLDSNRLSNGHRRHGRGHGKSARPVKVCRQMQRASTKACNVRRHKRHCGARS